MRDLRLPPHEHSLFMLPFVLHNRIHEKITQGRKDWFGFYASWACSRAGLSQYAGSMREGKGCSSHWGRKQRKTGRGQGQDILQRHVPGNLHLPTKPLVLTASWASKLLMGESIAKLCTFMIQSLLSSVTISWRHNPFLWGIHSYLSHNNIAWFYHHQHRHMAISLNLFSTKYYLDY